LHVATAITPGSLGDGSSVNTTDALIVGSSQIAALFAGISRSGITIVAGLLRGLDHEDAARFSFLLGTPIIFAAGMYKLPDLLGRLGYGVRVTDLGQCVLNSAEALTRLDANRWRRADSADWAGQVVGSHFSGVQPS
jgi:undecaprenyl-diphosphatase